MVDTGENTGRDSGLEYMDYEFSCRYVEFELSLKYPEGA